MSFAPYPVFCVLLTSIQSILVKSLSKQRAQNGLHKGELQMET